MTPLEQAVEAACRVHVKRFGMEFDDLPAIDKYHMREYVTSVVYAAITAYEEAKNADPAQG
jgi:hypothetical protein